MPNDGTGTGWIETSPANTEPRSLGAQEIRDLRIGLRLRMQKEHTTPAASTAGGEHKPGSAVAYTNATTAPTNRPDGVTPLGASDAGRIWFKNGGPSTQELMVWTGTAWSGIKLYSPGNIEDNVVITSKIQDGAVTAIKLASNAVITSKVQDGAITEPKLATDSVATNKIANGAVTASKLASDSVTTVKIQDGAVVTAKLANDAVTASKLAADAVTTAKIQDGAVTAPKLVSDSVTTPKIQDGAVTASKLAADAVTTAKIQDGAITTAKIGAAQVLPDNMTADRRVGYHTYVGNGSTSGPTITIGATAMPKAVIWLGGGSPLRMWFARSGDTTVRDASGSSTVSTAVSFAVGSVTITTNSTAINNNGTTYHVLIFY